MFRIYQRYIVRKTVTVFVASAIIISTCLVVLNLLRLIKNARIGISLELFLIAVGYLNLFILSFSVPLSILIACLLVFGRMSADNEITAFRASGFRTSAVALPPLLLSILLSLFMLYVNGVVSPQGHYKMSQLEFLTGSVNPLSLFQPRTSNNFGDYTVFINRIEGNRMYGIRLMEIRGEQTADITATFGELKYTPGNPVIHLNLFKAEVSIPTDDGVIRESDRLLSIEFNLEQLLRAVRKGRTTDNLTMKELILRRKLLRQERSLVQYFEIMRLKDVVSSPPPEGTDALMRHIRNINRGLIRLEKYVSDTRTTEDSYLYEINKRFVLSISSFVFCFVAIPLSIRINRRERMINILIGVVIALLYYTVIIVIEKSAAGYSRHLLVWLPPAMTMVLAIWMYTRINRGL